MEFLLGYLLPEDSIYASILRMGEPIKAWRLSLSICWIPNPYVALLILTLGTCVIYHTSINHLDTSLALSRP
jgi:hypothetical protein